MFQVIIACNGIVCLSTTRYGRRRTGTLSLKQYTQCDETYIEWEPIDDDVVWKTNVNDLRCIVIKRRRCLLLMYKYDEWNSEYYFPRGNARSFVRMLEVSHCVKYKWSPIPFALHFTIVEKQKSIRKFSDLKIEHILGAKQIGRNGKVEQLRRNAICTRQSAVKLTSMHCDCNVKTKNGGIFTRVFRCVKITITKIINCPLVWPIVESMGRAAVNTAVHLVKTKVIRSRFVQKIRDSGISTKICVVAIKLNLIFWSSLLTGAYRAIKYFCDDRCNDIQSIGVRHLIQ